MGGFKSLESNKVDSIITAHKEFPQKIEHFSGKLSEVNLKYLRKCVDICNEYNKKIIFVRTPQHPAYEGFELEDQFLEILNGRFNDVPFLDFKEYKMDDSEYADLGHLNFLGSKRFSIHFNDILKEMEVDGLSYK